jgi:hypothetical protein
VLADFPNPSLRDFGVRRNPRALVAWRWGLRGICGHAKIR